LPSHAITAPQNPKQHGSLPSKRPRNHASSAAIQAQQESTAKLPAKRRNLDQDNRTLPENSTGSILSNPAKEPHPILIREREVAHAIHKNGKLREPGPCYQCLHRRKSKGLEFPTCKVAVGGRRRRCAWCTHQQQRCTDELLLFWAKKWRRQGKDNGKSQEEHVHSDLPDIQHALL